MIVELSEPVEALVRKLLASGAFRDEQELIQHALTVLEEDEWHPSEREDFEREIQAGLDSLDAGPNYGPEAAERRLQELRAEHLRQMRP